MNSLSLDTKNYACVVSLKGFSKEEAVEKLDDLVLNFCSLGSIAGIVHDSDIDEMGELKTLHIHLVISLKKRKKATAVINSISAFADVSAFAVSVRKAVSIASCVQYLTHRNQPEKVQYREEDIFKFWNPEEWELLYNGDTEEVLDFETLYRIVRECDTKTEVMRKVGLSYYRNYRPCIDVLWNDKH